MSTYTVSGITYDTATGRPINRDGGLLLDSEIKASSRSTNTTNTTNTGKTRDRKFGDFRYPVARIESDSDYLLSLIHI